MTTPSLKSVSAEAEPPCDAVACSEVTVRLRGRGDRHPIVDATVIAIEAPPGSDVDACVSPYPLPTTMTNHGHRTMYRKLDPLNQFHHTINFTIGSAGAYIEADLRYNFQVAGLAARLQLANPNNPKVLQKCVVMQISSCHGPWS